MLQKSLINQNEERRRIAALEQQVEIISLEFTLKKHKLY